MLSISNRILTVIIVDYNFYSKTQTKLLLQSDIHCARLTSIEVVHGNNMVPSIQHLGNGRCCRQTR